MRSFFILIASAILVTAIGGVEMAWDASYILYTTLDRQEPIAFYGRLTHIPLNWLVIQSSHLTNQPFVLMTAFGLIYGSVTLFALAASWWIVRDRAPSLFVWASLGIALGALPGQVCSVCQANLNVQLFYPILLWILVGATSKKTPVVLLLAAAIFFFHPVAIPLFALAGVCAFLVGIRMRERRRALFVWAIVFASLAVAAEAKLVSSGSEYELGQLSATVLQARFNEAVRGLPLAALVLSWVAAFAVLFGSLLGRGTQIWPKRAKFSIPPPSSEIQVVPSSDDKPGSYVAQYPSGRVPTSGKELGRMRNANIDARHNTRRRIAYAIAFGATTLAGLLLSIWASIPHLWAEAVNFRAWVLFTSIPFFGIAMLDSLLLERLPDGIGRDWSLRLRLSQAVAAVFIVVLVIQSAVWVQLSGRLQDAMSTSVDPCVSTASLTWLDRTPLYHWSISAYSLLVQGQSPTRVVMVGRNCTTVSFREGLPVAIFGPGDWDLHSWTGGWFDLRSLGNQLVRWQERPPSCQFPFSAGWFGIEEEGYDWWRWTSGKASARVILADATTVTLTGQIVSLRQPNQVDIVVNGSRQASLDITLDGFQPIAPLRVDLKAGENEIVFIGRNPPEKIPTDSRLLAFAVKDLAVTFGDGSTICR